MADFTDFNYNNLVMNFKNILLEHKRIWYPNGLDCVDKETFMKDNKVANAESIFAQLDFNNDGYVDENEFGNLKRMDADKDGVVSEKEYNDNRAMAYDRALFEARRNIDKWFTMDINRDGHLSNVEEHLSKFCMWEDEPTKEHQKDSSMTNSELAEKYNMTENLDNETDTLAAWMKRRKNQIIENTQNNWGVILTDAEIVNIQKEMIKQLNTWLFKTGDNATHDAPLYQSLNIDSYTRLVTPEETSSCCGGDIIPPPAACEKTGCDRLFTSFENSPENEEKMTKELQEFDANCQRGDMTEEEFDKYRVEEMNKIEKRYTPHNKAEEFHNRLAWAIYPTPAKAREIQEQIRIERQEVEDKVRRGEMTREEADEMEWPIWSRMSDEEYAQYHEQYMNIRNMTAADYRELLKPENEEAMLKFEENSDMRVYQIVQYIDIVESVTGVDFDSDEWNVYTDQFWDIVTRVNDTQDDSELLQGKTRADIPENRQDLLRFLEENGWLYEQFK